MVEEIPGSVIREAAEKAGVSEETVRKVAEKYEELITAMSNRPIVCFWAGLRCITCIGIVRKIFWCLVYSLCVT